MNRLCSICVRAGSKGVPNKNIRLLCGKPLLVYSIKQAVESGLFTHIAVSSDSEEILRIAQGAGVSLLVERPADLAADSSPKIPAIQHCLRTCEELSQTVFETIVDLGATSPLRLPDDIRACVELLESDRAITNVITGAPARNSPYFSLVEEGEDRIVVLSKKSNSPILRRQDAPPCYDMNGSIYAWRRDVLLGQESVFLSGTRLYVMPEERSFDIDTELDFQIVEMIMSKFSSKKV